MNKNLNLYILNACPYCKKVLNFMNANNINNIKIFDISKKENETYLIENGGKKQVPCLFIDGKVMYESNDIIEFLKKEFNAKIELNSEDINMCPII